MSEIRVAALNHYPIKACRGISRQQMPITELGPEYDREWAIVRRGGQVLTQRNFPQLATVETRLEADALIAVAPGMGELAIPLDRKQDAPEVRVTLWKKTSTATHEAPEASRYFTQFLGREVHLARFSEPRPIKPALQVDGASRATGFADAFQMLLTSTSSLAELNLSLDDPVPMDRFRPNIVVEGSAPYEEDRWREICIGDMRTFVVYACARCNVPNIDQNRGTLPPQEDRHVTHALRATRRGIDPLTDTVEEYFGQNVTHVPTPGLVLNVGDPVDVVQIAWQPNFGPPHIPIEEG